MGSISDYLENALLNHVFQGGSSPLAAPTIYVGLSTADPLDDGAGLAEPSGNNYARVAHAGWSSADNRQVENVGAVTFSAATGPWGTISHFALFDAATGGNLLAHGALSVAKNVVAANTPHFNDGDITVSFQAGAISDYLAEALLDHVFQGGSAPFSAPTIYAAFSTADPTDDGSGLTEPSGNNYARAAHSAWTSASGGQTNNDGDIDFNTPSGSWGTITHLALMDASASGNMLFYGAVTSQEPDDGDTVRIESGDLVISMS